MIFKLFLSLILGLVLLIVGEQAYNAFVLGGQLRHGGLTSNALTVLWYVSIAGAAIWGLTKVWSRK